MTEDVRLIDKTAVILWSDAHQNHIFSLCPPNFSPSERGVWELNPPQKHLWYAWNTCWDWAMRVTEGYTRVGFGVGDLIENDTKNRNRSELISQIPSDALAMVSDTLEPIVQELDHFFVVEGTHAHSGESAWTEREIARDLGAVPDTARKSPAWQHFIGEFSGVKFDIAHHPSGNSNIPRNYAAVASRLAYDTMTSYAMNWEEKPPHVVVRAHLHRFADSGLSYKTRGVILPGFQYKTYYLGRLGKDADLPEVGMVVILCENGEYELLEKRPAPTAKRKIWRIQKTPNSKSPPETKS